jgi:L-alanine-DL-glutamate epimerase-like enolase superfamily enzyme
MIKMTVVMRIVCAQLYPLEVPMTKPIKMAGETLTHAQTLLLCLIDELGREGWGEASSAPLMTGETLGSIVASTEYLVSKLMGIEFSGPQAISALQNSVLYGNASAKSCHETALMDLFSQRAGMPLHELLRGNAAPRSDGRLEMLHMLASGNLQGELDEAMQLRKDGYRQWKIKVGTGDVANDVRRVRAICQALEGDVVSADANQALSIADARTIAKAGLETGLDFLEQPFTTYMTNDMVSLHRDTRLPLCADESIQDVSDIVNHAELKAAQGVSLKLIKLGGTQALLEAGRLSLARGLRVNLACKVAETTISAAATAHAGFALGDVAWGFSMSNRYLAVDVCAHPLAPANGAVTIEQMNRPGLGFAADATRLRDFASGTLPVREFRA